MKEWLDNLREKAEKIDVLKKCLKSSTSTKTNSRTARQRFQDALMKGNSIAAASPGKLVKDMKNKLSKEDQEKLKIKKDLQDKMQNLLDKNQDLMKE